MTWEQMERAIEFLTAQATEQSAKLAQMIEVVNRDGEHIRMLARVAELQNERLKRLEDKTK